MILGIDASSIKSGGGLVHLIHFVKFFDIADTPFKRVIIWASTDVLDQLDCKPFLIKDYQPFLDRGILSRLFWIHFSFKKKVKSVCDFLFYPGGSATYKKIPYVTMNRNMLPFDSSELFRYGFSRMTLRLLLLRWLQYRSYKKACGVIFLSEYARSKILKKINLSATAVIPHGRSVLPNIKPYETKSSLKIFKVLYVSIIDVYKHHIEVIEAICQLRRSNINIELTMIGPAYRPQFNKVENLKNKIDAKSKFIKYIPCLDHAALLKKYNEADAFVFASSCETFGQILLEAMAVGLPIACSNKAAMPEIAKDSALYFDPSNPFEIASQLKRLYSDHELRQSLSQRAHQYSLEYDWGICIKRTLEYLSSNAIRNCKAMLDIDENIKINSLVS